MEINIFFEGVDSIKGFQSSMLNEIDKKIPIHRCIVTTKTNDDTDIYDADKYVCINYDICEHNLYEDFYDFNDMIPLSKELLEAMRPYESTAMQMLVRNFERDVYTIDESKHFYLNHLRFWNHMIQTEKINLICLNNIPHHSHDYIIYALGKINHINICLCADTSIQPRLSVGTDLEGLWEKNHELYEKYRLCEEVILPEDIEHYYQALKYGYKGIDDSAVHRGMSRKDHINIRRKNFTQYFELKKVIRRNGSLLKHGLKADLSNGKLEQLKVASSKILQNRNYEKRAKIKLHSMRNIKYYDKIAEYPDFNEKYVIFFLHLQPEATTLPQGGVFVEQELMIQILAHTMEQHGIKVYVKEHFVQPYRNKNFYDGLKKIRNVKLINSNVDSKELAKKSIATASCNGTILLESIFNNKQTFIFGHTGFQGAPGVYLLGNTEDCEKAINEIISGKNPINQKEVRAYLAAFADNSIRAYFNVTKYENDETLTMEDGKLAYVNWIVENMKKLQ